MHFQFYKHMVVIAFLRCGVCQWQRHSKKMIDYGSFYKRNVPELFEYNNNLLPATSDCLRRCWGKGAIFIGKDGRESVILLFPIPTLRTVYCVLPIDDDSLLHFVMNTIPSIGIGKGGLRNPTPPSTKIHYPTFPSMSSCMQRHRASRADPNPQSRSPTLREWIEIWVERLIKVSPECSSKFSGMKLLRLQCSLGMDLWSFSSWWRSPGDKRNLPEP